jgi:chorismate mutase
VKPLPQDAKEDLERAREELDEAIAQLRQQLQDEVLRALEERFTAMLARQRELSLQTRTLDQTRQQVLTADGSLPTALAERIQVVAEGEGDLEVEAADALKLLAEEGTTAVFPEIVAELREQLQRVTRRCRSNETGDRVQEQQQEIEDTLELLINSLRKTIERREGG